jgi:hypothetical protein
MLTVQIAVGAGSLLGGIAAILLVIRCRRSRAKSVGPTGNTHRAFGRSRAQVGSGASTSSRTADERGVATHGIALEEDFDIVKAARPVRQTGAAVRPARDREAEATIDLKKDKDLEAEATIDFVKKNKPVAPAFASIASALDSSSSAASIAPPALPLASVAPPALPPAALTPTPPSERDPDAQHDRAQHHEHCHSERDHQHL